MTVSMVCSDIQGEGTSKSKKCHRKKYLNFISRENWKTLRFTVELCVRSL